LFAVDDKHHARLDRLIKKLSRDGLRLLTTWPCVVEASYLLDIPQRFEMLHWVELGGVIVYPFEPHNLTEMVKWMQQYTEPRGREMDLAEDSLFWVASEAGILDILTVDVADFSRYRLPDKRVFNIL